MAAMQQMQQQQQHQRAAEVLFSRCRGTMRSHGRNKALSGACRTSAAAVSSEEAIMQHGAHTQQGTSRVRNEDRFDVQIVAEADVGLPLAYMAVFDGHGGTATSDWLETNFSSFAEKHWLPDNPGKGISEAFLQADKKLLAPRGGFFGGMGERGIGGSKCGATGAVALIWKDAQGRRQLVAANAGDARVVLARGGRAVQLTVDHVPDSNPLRAATSELGKRHGVPYRSQVLREQERLRIEALNPNKKYPMVRYVAGTWRVGGLLALSRAFGDAYLKGTGQFEGIPAGSDGYSSGFGVIAQPDVSVTELTDDDSWLIIASDGLFENEVRGGGGGLDNQEVVDLCLKQGSRLGAEDIAAELAEQAVQRGSTDDVTVVVIKIA